MRGRYSMLGFDPDLLFRAEGAEAEIAHAPNLSRFSPCAEDSLTALRKLIGESHIAVPRGLPPMSAGVFGYLGYDMVRLMERLPPPNPKAVDVPDAILMRPRVVAIFDAVKDELTVVTPVRAEPGVNARAAYDRAINRLIDVVDALDRPVDHAPEPADIALNGEVRLKHDARRIQGDGRRARRITSPPAIFSRWCCRSASRRPFRFRAFSLYRALRRVNPSPFLYFLDFDDFSIVGSSPEILVRVRDGDVTIRPIAGTRPRGKTPEEDKRLGEELLADPKERAEHLMLLDLGRNDAGRVATLGSVRVTDQFFLEHYSHVMHIVSNVVGKLRPDQRRARRARRRLSRRHRLRRAKSARDGDHRRAGEGQARPLRRLRRLFLGRRRDGHLHRPPHRDGEGRKGLRAGRRRHRRRFQSGVRAAGMHQQSRRDFSRRR